jgi:hypothetical protein
MDNVFNVSPGKRLWAVKESGKIREMESRHRMQADLMYPEGENSSFVEAPVDWNPEGVEFGRMGQLKGAFPPEARERSSRNVLYPDAGDAQEDGLVFGRGEQGMFHDLASEEAFLSDGNSSLRFKTSPRPEAAQPQPRTTLLSQEPYLKYDPAMQRMFFYDGANTHEYEARNKVVDNPDDDKEQAPIEGGYYSSEVGLREIPKNPSYGHGKAYIDTKDLRRRHIHGGGSSLPDPYAPRQGWRPTYGCIRMQNEDIQNLWGKIKSYNDTTGKDVPFQVERR